MNKPLYFDITGTTTITHKEDTMYKEESMPAGSSLKTCKQPRNGVTATITLLNIDGKIETVIVVDEVVFTKEEEAIEVFKKTILKTKGEWDNYIAKNYE